MFKNIYLLLTHFMQDIYLSDQNYFINHTDKFESGDTFFPVKQTKEGFLKCDDTQSNYL